MQAIMRLAKLGQKRRLCKMREDMTKSGVVFVPISETAVLSLWNGDKTFLIQPDIGWQAGDVIRFDVYDAVNGRKKDDRICYYDYVVTYRDTKHVDKGYVVLGIKRKTS